MTDAAAPDAPDNRGVFDSRYLAFLGTIPQIRPKLLRYCARMTGSVLDGEDVVQGSARVEPAADVVLVAEVSVDGQPPEVVELPTSHVRRRYAPFWRYGLSPGRHTVSVKMRPVPPGATLFLERVIVYGAEPRRPPV